MAAPKPVGIRLERKKDASLLNWNLKRLHPPEKICVPLRQGSRPCVRVGEQVRIGQRIGEPENPEEATVHASISGTVTEIAAAPDAMGGMSVRVVIQKSTEPKLAPGVWEIRKGWEQIPAGELEAAFQCAGLVTTDLSAEPVHSKIKRHAAASTLVVNCCEPEPYVTCEQTLLLSHPVEVLKGAELLRKALGAEKILLAFETCNFEIGELLKSKIFFLKWTHAEARAVPSLYPQGTERLLLQNWFPGEKEKAVVFPASTAFAAYEAVAHQKPFYERLVTVGGECVVEPRSLWLPLGISFQDAIHACKGVMREPERVVMNGPMAGIAQADLNVPVTAGTAAVLALPKEITKKGPEEPCIRCNLCVNKCPAGISPVMITLAADHQELETAGIFGAAACIECGNCGYVCPSQRPMLEKIRTAKKKLGISGTKPAGAHHG